MAVFQYDCIVIGGGPAGIMAALSVKHQHPQYSVAILDRSFELARKLLVSGAGRGNITNIHIAHTPEEYFHGDKQCIATIFSQFGYREIIAFFEDLGIPTYEEKKTVRGKIFPVIDHAKTVRDILVDALKEQSISVFYSVNINSLVHQKDSWLIKTNDAEYSSKNVILSTGGKTYPAYGSDGSGFDLAASIGHTIIPPVVSAVPLVSKNMLSHYMQGEKMEMRVTSVVGGREKATAIGDVLFTQYGFSGPAVFDISHDISVRLNREKISDTSVRLSFFPHNTTEEVRHLIQARLDRHPTLPVSHCLWGLCTQKTAGAVCAVSKIPKDHLAEKITSQEVGKLINTLTAFTSDVSGTRGWNEGEFTAGGVDTDEVDHRTLQSKKNKGLYFAGEILNIDGQVGGYNLSWAWASGWVAGKLGT